MSLTGNEGQGDCYVTISGTRYTDFTALTLKRAKQDMSASGTFTLSWPGAEMFNEEHPPAQELVDGAKGAVFLDGHKAATFRIDSRTSKGSKDHFQLELSFRGLSSAIVDSSADHPSGQENKKKPGDICKKLMEGYEPEFIDESDDDRTLERFIVCEGETVERSMRRAAREYGMLLEEDEDGNVVLKGEEDDEGSGQPLVLGANFVEWSVKRDISPRYSKVKAKGNAVPTDERYGKDAEELAGEAIDEYVEYKRELHILIESDQDKETLKDRAIAEANRRKAAGLNVTLTMSTWSDDDGELWTVGKKHQVEIPVDQVDDELIISAVTFNLDKTKRRATLTLVSPESFTKQGKGKKGDRGGAKSGKSKKKKGSGGKRSGRKGKGRGGGGGGTDFREPLWSSSISGSAL